MLVVGRHLGRSDGRKAGRTMKRVGPIMPVYDDDNKVHHGGGRNRKLVNAFTDKIETSKMLVNRKIVLSSASKKFRRPNVGEDVPPSHYRYKGTHPPHFLIDHNTPTDNEYLKRNDVCTKKVRKSMTAATSACARTDRGGSSNSRRKKQTPASAENGQYHHNGGVKEDRKDVTGDGTLALIPVVSGRKQTKSATANGSKKDTKSAAAGTNGFIRIESNGSDGSSGERQLTTDAVARSSMRSKSAIDNLASIRSQRVRSNNGSSGIRKKKLRTPLAVDSNATSYGRRSGNVGETSLVSTLEHDVQVKMFRQIMKALMCQIKPSQMQKGTKSN